MENLGPKLRKNQRDYLLEKVMDEIPMDETTELSYSILKQTLNRGKLVGDDDELDKVVELNSTVAVKTSFGFRFGLKVVLPEEGDIQFNKLSVFSPLGCAIYGHKEGDKVKWYFLGEEEYAEIVKVTRPRCEITHPPLFRH